MHHRHHASLEAVVADQQRSVARGPVTEAEVLTDGHMRRAQRTDQHRIDEIRSSAMREGLVERDDHQFLHAQLCDQFNLHVETREQLRCAVGLHDRGWMGLEGEHRVIARDHLAVAEVDSIELAHRNATGPRLDIAERCDAHRGQEG